MGKAIDTLDAALLVLAIRIAHWADYRWHFNTYRIAKAFLRLATVCVIAAAFTSFIPFPKGAADITGSTIILLVNVFIAYGYTLRADRIEKMSQAYERDPSDFPQEAVRFYFQPGFMRIFAAFLPLTVLPIIFLADLSRWNHSIWLAALDALFRLWLLFGDCIAIYFAMVPPSGRQRKEKKARDWSFGLTPQPLRS